MSEWTDELKEQVIADYKAEKPTPETTTDIVHEIAEKVGKTGNGVMRILVTAGVYVSKSASNTTAKTARRGKAEIIGELTELLDAQNIEADDDILSKLTGKAGTYFISVLKQLTEPKDV